MHFSTESKRLASVLLLGGLLAGGLSACSNGTDKAPTESSSPEQTSAEATPSPTQEAKKEVTLLAYDSFNLSDEAVATFEKESGYTLNVISSGDGVELTNKLVLTKDNPLGDVAFGMDNNTAMAAVEAGVFEESGVELPAGAAEYALESAPQLLPVDHSDICLNYDIAWFKEKGLAVPATYEDLLKPDYKDLTVVEDPRNSTPGLAFMLGTINHFGEGKWADYWKDLKANGVKVAKGWSEAFDADFTAGSNKSNSASYPIMVSYSSSPAWAVNEEMTASSIGNVPDTCYQDIEYTGLLKGAKNEEGGKALIKFLLSETGQRDFVENNYVYPVNSKVELPEALAKFGAMVPQSAKMDGAKVAKNREAWLREWTEAIGG